MKMDPEIKTKWVAALRSGKYEQGTEVLKQHECDNDGNVTKKVLHCCLGVLCELAVEAGLGLRIEKIGSQWEYNERSELPPEEVAEWAGIEEDGDPGVINPNNGRRTTLASLNDNGFNFESIADVIERDL